MEPRVLVLQGTRKGAFILETNAPGREAPGVWRLRGPLCEGWPINHFCHDAATGTIYAGGGSPWFGAAVWRSDDLGATWTHSSAGLTYGDAGPKMRSVWHVTPAHAVRWGPSQMVPFGGIGSGIEGAQAPVVTPVSCSNLAPSGATVAATGKLRYDAGADQYIYTWQTDKSLTGGCAKLSFLLVDGTRHSAYFDFRK